jgi:hypothetical protein
MVVADSLRPVTGRAFLTFISKLMAFHLNITANPAIQPLLLIPLMFPVLDFIGIR